MQYFDYKDAPYRIRDDIGAAHRNFWKCLASAGSWWSGPERVAIAQEVRNATDCRYCVERKKALSPYTHDGQHDCGDVLDAASVDAVHRIVTDQARITQAYVDQNAKLLKKTNQFFIYFD